ncbi:MAG: oligosaccharide flippase family protein [Paracoccaceae bacterium]
MNQIKAAFLGNHLMARVLRSGSWLLIGYGSSQALRLAANLILARLLFPEAFGLMALINVITLGLNLFSDTGINAAIAQSDRGDDPDFLDTAYSIQVVRGVVLWAFTLALAWPAAHFYGENDLLIYLPIAGIALVFNGFIPTRTETANRHLMVGRVTALDLISQIIGLVFMIGLALATRSVLALVLGGVVQAGAKLALMHFFLPGRENHFRWENKAVREQLHFGKWIFLSTAFFFVTSQGDRLLLGWFVPLKVLGLYNIGFFLASFPMLLGYALNQRLLIPVYREKPARAAPENWQKQRLLRCTLSIGILSLLLGIGAFGPAMVDTLYDDRYAMSGPIVTLISISLIPGVVCFTYDPAALAAGDSRTYFIYTASRAILQTVLFLLGLHYVGIIGGIAAFGLSMLAAYPVLVWLAVKHGVWDPLHDILSFAISGVLGAWIIWFHWADIQSMSQTLN